MDRIADLALLGDISHHYNRTATHKGVVDVEEESNHKIEIGDKSTLLSKHVQISDEWETFKVCFSVFGGSSPSNFDTMKVCYSTEVHSHYDVAPSIEGRSASPKRQYSPHNYSPSRSARVSEGRGSSPKRQQSLTRPQHLNDEYIEQEMVRAETFKDWAYNKFGKKVKPYECLVSLQNPKRSSINEHLKIFYHYQFQAGGMEYPERSPVRFFEVQDPKNYHGVFGMSGSALQYDTCDVFMVNGLIQKCDGHFLDDFSVNLVCAQTLKDTGNLFIGCYPSSEYDI